MTTARTRPQFDTDRVDVSKLFDRLPPHSLEMEMCLLGSMIMAGTENIHIIGEGLQALHGPEDFYLPKHQAIYRAIIDQYDDNQSLDIPQLLQSLRDRQLEQNIGGVDYLVELTESVPTAVNAMHYARVVRDKARLRRLVDAAGNILREAYESTDTARIIVDKAEQLIFEVAQKSGAGDAATLKELVEQAFEQLEARQESGHSLTGLDSGFQQLNDKLGGLQAGEMLILAARPSMGKTALALNIAEHIAVYLGQPSAVFSLEMSKQQLAERMLSSHSGVDGQRIRRGMLGPDDLSRLTESAGDLSEAPLYIDDTPGLSALELRAKARRLYTQHSIKFVVVDYLQLMSYPGAESRVQEVSAISRAIKALARELNVPVLCLSQLNRNPEGRESKRPMLADLRESGAIEQDADVVMMLHREEYYHPDEQWRQDHSDKIGLAELIIAKQRNGPTGTVPLQFDHTTTRFHNKAGGFAAVDDIDAISDVVEYNADAPF